MLPGPIVSDLKNGFFMEGACKNSADVFEMSDAMQMGDVYAWNWHCYDVTDYGEVLETNGKDVLLSISPEKK